MKTPVLSAAPGQLIKFHGEPCLVLEHRTDGTLLLATNQVQKPFGTDNDFAKSTLMDHLNGPWLEALTENHPEEVLPRIVDLTAVNGSKQYGFCKCKAAAPTANREKRTSCGAQSAYPIDTAIAGPETDLAKSPTSTSSALPTCSPSVPMIVPISKEANSPWAMAPSASIPYLFAEKQMFLRSRKRRNAPFCALSSIFFLPVRIYPAQHRSFSA